MLRQARLAEAATLAWMVLECVLALAAGVAARSLVLVAFGVDSGIELLAATVVMRRLLQRTPEEEAGALSDGERSASRVLGWALRVLIAYIVVGAAAALAFRVHPEPSLVGIGLTSASVLVMAVLWRWRSRLAERLGSPALKADAACSMACLWMAAAALAGLLLNQALGLWWADALAGLLLVWWIHREAQEALEAARPLPDEMGMRK